MPPILPKEKIEEIKKRLTADLTENPSAEYSALARKYGVSSSTVARQAYRLGITKAGDRKAAEQAMGAKLQAMVAERLASEPKLTFTELAQETGINAQKIAYWAEKKNLGRRRRQSTPADHARWVQMFERGLNINRIAQIAGFHEATVAKALAAHGIDTVQARRTPLAEAAKLIESHGLSSSEAAERVGVSLKKVINYRHRLKKKEIENADSNTRVDVQQRDDQPNNREQQAGGGGDASRASLGGPHDLRTQEGREDHSRLAGSDAPEGQAPRERLRRCG